MFWLSWLCFGSLFFSTLATSTCPVLHYWNGTSCNECTRCPRGFGVKTHCTEKANTVYEPCWPQFDYSNTTGFERCILCDQNSNCLPGNPKVIKNCTVFSPTVCQGCAEGNYFDRFIGENGGCTECSPPCGVFEKEDRPCTTEHDRVCIRIRYTPKWLQTESPTENAFVSSVSPANDGQAEGRVEPSAEAEKIPHTAAPPFHKKAWFWPTVGIVAVISCVPVVVLTAIKCRNHGRKSGSGNCRGNTMPTRSASRRNNELMQQRSPLVARDGLDLPIRDLSVEQKRFISLLFNDKDTLGYFYWQRVADRVGLRNEARAWGGFQNPTEAFLTTYGEKSGSTVRTLIVALKEDQLTHFASQVEEWFSTAQDHVDTNRVDETAM